MKFITTVSKSFYIFFFLFLLNQGIFGQNLARITGRMIQKEKGVDQKITISTGNFYFDTKFKKLVYDLIFPTRYTWVAKDTNLLKFEKNKLIQRISSLAVPEFSIFNLALNGNLKDYGLKKSGFDITSTEKVNNTVYITYTPPAALKQLSKIVLAQKNNQLDAIVFYDKNGKVINKQFYKKYIVEKGVAFPTEVTTISIKNNQEQYQLTTYENLKVNDFQNNNFYDYKLPSYIK